MGRTLGAYFTVPSGPLLNEASGGQFMSLDINKIKEQIEHGNTSLGIDWAPPGLRQSLSVGTTPIASGRSRLGKTGMWITSGPIPLEDIWTGIRDCYGKMAEDVKETYGTHPDHHWFHWFSAMMHGYMAFDKEGELQLPFRTWRNTIYRSCRREADRVFQYNIPQRWSIAHLYQAIPSIKKST